MSGPTIATGSRRPHPDSVLDRLWPLVLVLNLGVAAVLAFAMGMFFGQTFANIGDLAVAVPVGLLVGALVLAGGVWLSFRETRRFRERPEDGFLVKPLRYSRDHYTTKDGRPRWTVIIPLLVGEVCLWVGLFDGARFADFTIMPVNEVLLRLVFVAVGIPLCAVATFRFYRPR